MFALPIVVLAGLLWLEWRRTDDRPPSTPLPWPAPVMATCSVGAGAVHAVVVGEHAEHAWVQGAFFLCLAAVQVVLAVALLGRVRPQLVRAGVGLNAAVVGLWAWSRSSGLPWGIGREGVGVLDLLATTFEVGCVASGALLLYRATGDCPPPDVAPTSKCEISTVRNSPPPRNVSVPSGAVPSQDTNSLRPSKLSTFATRS
jgi:hypothetical protein